MMALAAINQAFPRKLEYVFGKKWWGHSIEGQKKYVPQFQKQNRGSNLPLNDFSRRGLGLATTESLQILRAFTENLYFHKSVDNNK
ncbi:hypothetical protein SUGI_1028810 [Cryptomeria japonica]|nr:hypothetical protein SUGI_1028810 [Cryptomeria japonica]